MPSCTQPCSGWRRCSSPRRSPVVTPTAGRAQDRVTVTELAVDYVRRYGFDPGFQANYTLEMGYSLDRTATDPDMENMIARLVGETHELLIHHRTFLVELARLLHGAGKLDAAAITVVAARHAVTAEVRPAGHLHLPHYEEALNALDPPAR